MIEYDTFLCLSKSPHVCCFGAEIAKQVKVQVEARGGGNLEVTQGSVVVQTAKKGGGKMCVRRMSYSVQTSRGDDRAIFQLKVAIFAMYNLSI